MEQDLTSRFRAETEASPSAIPCVVTAVNLDGDPLVSVRPLQALPYDLFDGEVAVDTPLEIAEIPYGYSSGTSFAMFVPPEIGMQGVLIVSDTEVGEIPAGVATTSRRKHGSSGYFVPTGNVGGTPFKGSADWAEIRTTNCRIAASKDTVHLESGDTSITITQDSFDVVVGGISLIGALKQMSAHIKALEQLVHPNGMTHGPVKQRQIDDITAATPPVRSETGVR